MKARFFFRFLPFFLASRGSKVLIGLPTNQLGKVIYEKESITFKSKL